MRALIQRVTSAKVEINSVEERSISSGLLIFLGVGVNDNKEDVLWLAAKIGKLRIFDDNNGIMNNSIIDIGGDVMVISQFTLYAKTKKGNRPSYINAAEPDFSKPFYEEFVRLLSMNIGKDVITGEFGAHMKVELLNDGPVTIWIDTNNKE